MSKDILTSIKMTDEYSESNGIIYYFTWATSRGEKVIRMELAPEMAESSAWHYGIAITTR